MRKDEKEVETKTAYEKAAGLMNQWYTMIKRHEALQAASLKQEIKELLANMEKTEICSFIFIFWITATN